MKSANTRLGPSRAQPSSLISFRSRVNLMWTTRSWLRILTAAALCVTAVHCGSFDGSSIPRGANPSDAARYASSQHGSPSGIFVCDGDRSIDRDRVNDDYCDCDDGTDEPGTSACANGEFHCRNRGHKPASLPSSRVNDGVCDCCDGTDEHDGRTNCANTCVQAGAARRDAIRTKVHAAKGGVDRGRKIRDAAPALRRKWMDESATLEKDVAAQRAIVHDANVAKDVAEREESDATKAEERLNKREAARNSSSSSADESSPDGGAESVPHASPTPPVEPGTEDDPEFPVDDFEEDRMPDDFEEDRIPIDSPEAAELAKDLELTETEEERGQRIAQQWIHGDSESTGRVEPPPPDTSTDDADDDDANLTPEERKKRDMDRMIAEAARNQAIAEGAGGIPAGAYQSNTDAIPDPEPATSMGEAAGDDADEEDLGEDDDETDDETDESGSGGGFFSSLFSGGKPKSKRGGRAIRDRATRAKKHANDKRDVHAQAQRTLTELEGKHADVTKRLGTFFGPHMELAHMVGECYAAKIETYKYEVCPFGDAKQDTTKLGTMKALDVKEPRTMVFSSGERCWNGPSRSITVYLKCGGENVLAEVEEPSRCEYAATLYTPAACDAEEVEALERELEEMEEEARAAMGVHDEL